MAERHSTIRVTRRYSAPPARVFDAWLDPKVAGRWLFATASRPVAHVDIDARVDGAFRLVERQDGEAIEHAGEYIEINRPRRLAFTLSEDRESMNVTRVIVEITPVTKRPGGTGGAGRPHARHVEGARTHRSIPRCELVLVHEKVPAKKARRTEARWTGILYGLHQTLAALSNSGRAKRL